MVAFCYCLNVLVSIFKERRIVLGKEVVYLSLTLLSKLSTLIGLIEYCHLKHQCEVFNLKITFKFPLAVYDCEIMVSTGRVDYYN